MKKILDKITFAETILLKMPQGDKQDNILEETGVEKKDIYL